MKRSGKLLRRILAYIEDKTGVSTVEYALIVVAVIAIVAAGAGVLGGAFTDMFDDLKTQIETAQKDLSS